MHSYKDRPEGYKAKVDVDCEVDSLLVIFSGVPGDLVLQGRQRSLGAVHSVGTAYNTPLRFLKMAHMEDSSYFSVHQA